MRNVAGNSGIIDRPRLLKKLSGAVTHKLTVISAPPGYGKTTLAAQFADKSAYPVVWHTLEDRDRDVPTLHADGLMALEAIFPGVQSLQTPSDFSPSELAALITNFLRESLTGDLLYILDDVQLLNGAPGAEAWLRSLVALLPRSCHLILISRNLPDLPLVDMLARRELLAMGQDDLRLTRTEIEQLAEETSGFRANAGRIEEIETQLEGWPAGTVLALYPLPEDFERAILRGQRGPEALFYALAQVMLDAQSPEIANFLLASSVFKLMTPELCEQILALPNSIELLSKVKVRNLFLTKARGGYVYHSLFRSFLETELKRRSPDRFSALHMATAHHFERLGDVDSAFSHYYAAGLIEKAAEIAEQAARTHFIQGKQETLLEWKAKLAQADTLSPGVLYHCAIIHGDRYAYDQSEADLSLAEAFYLQRHDATGLINIEVQRATIELQLGKYSSALSRAARLLNDVPESSRAQMRALNISGLAYLQLGDAAAALHEFEAALGLYREQEDSYSLSQLLQSLSMTYSRLGRLKDASACLQEVVALRRTLGGGRALALALNNLGLHYHRGSNFEQALITLEEGLGIVARFPDKRAETALLWTLAGLKRDLGAYDESLRLYQKALEILGSSDPSFRCPILLGLSTLKRWQENYQDALTLAIEAMQLADAHEMGLLLSLSQASVWIAHAHLGHAAEATSQLDLVATDLDQRGARYELAYVLNLRAQVALLHGQPLSAKDILREGKNLAEDIGSAQNIAADILRHGALKQLVKDSPAEWGIVARDMQKLERVVQNQIPAAVDVLDGQSCTLSVMTLGQEVIQRDGHAISLADWQANTAREFFFYLLFVGPNTREQICAIFWPDASAERVRNNFHSTVYRARQALGETTIVYEEGRYTLNPQIDIWCDAQAFERLVAQARLLPTRDARTEDLWRRALELYGGECLIKLDGYWIQPYREKLAEAYLEALLGYAECARSRGSFREAQDTLKRALKIDPLREDLHRALMKCFHESGQKHKIWPHFQKLQYLLRQEIHLEPSPETIALVNTLVS